MGLLAINAKSRSSQQPKYVSVQRELTNTAQIVLFMLVVCSGYST